MWAERGASIERLVQAELLTISGSVAANLYFDDIKENLRKGFPVSVEPASFIDLPRLVNVEVKEFIEKKRQQLWDDHKQLVASVIEKQPLPPALREFARYYANTLPQRVFARVRVAHLENQPAEDLQEWLTNYTREVLETEFTNDAGELHDEELVRLYRAGYENCRTILLERCAAKLHQLVPRILQRGMPICPLSEDPVEFAKEVAQEVSLKLLTELDTFDFRSSFNTWLVTICENEAYTKRRKLLGRSKQGERIYVSFEELQQDPAAPIRSEDHREILRKIIAKHRQQGPRAEKSADAIEWRYFEGVDSEKIAEYLHTTLAYVHQLFSHDYPELRRIALEDFGISGTDL